MLVYRNLKSSEISMYQQMLRMAAGVSQTSINFEGLNAFVHARLPHVQGWFSAQVDTFLQVFDTVTVIDYQTARTAAGGLVNILLSVAGLPPLREAQLAQGHAACASSEGHTSFGRRDEQLRQLLHLFAQYTAAHHGCELRYPSFNTNLSDALLLSRYTLNQTCFSLAALEQAARDDDQKLRGLHGHLFSPPVAAGGCDTSACQMIAQEPHTYCELDIASVERQPKLWHPRFKEQLRALPKGAACAGHGARRVNPVKKAVAAPPA